MTEIAGKRILVIEDEAVIAAMVEDMLTELGAVVVGPAGTLALGLELAEREEIDAAVLDVNLRSERVDPIADMLRARSIPVVFATGYGAAPAVGAGASPVLEKPYTMEKLASTLAGALTSASL